MNSLTPHVYWLPPEEIGDRPILGAVAGSRATLIVDAGNSPAHANLLLSQLAGLNLPPAKFVAITHWHWDHVFGIATLNLPTFAHRETQRRVAEMAGLDWSDAALDARVAAGQEIAFCRDHIRLELPERANLALRPPDIAFEAPVSIDLGGITCQLIPVGGDHASDSSVIYIPEERVMFIGDCLCADLYSGEPRYTPAGLGGLVERLSDYPVDFWLESHNPEPVSSAEMARDLQELKLFAGVVGANRTDEAEKIRRELEARLGAPLNEDQIGTLEMLLRGS